MDPLFPELPEDLSALSDEELDDLERQHNAAAELIEAEDEEYTEGYSAEEILAALETGVEQIEAIRAERATREEAKAEYQARKDELAARRKGEELSDEAEEATEGEEAAEGEESEEAEGEELAEETEEEAASEDEAEAEESEEEEPAAEVASAKPAPRRAVQRYRRPPAPSAERRREAASQGAVLVAAAGNQGVRAGQEMDRQSYAEAFRTTAQRRGRPSKSHAGVEEKILIASATYQFPEERILTGHAESDVEKLRAALPAYMDGAVGNTALVASGGLCAPLTPIYTMPNFATTARPVRDALPGFNADRGGVNVPTATTIGDITEAITVIDEAEDALGGTFATKSCQDLDCPAYTETAITIISHCREYGNLVAMTWPEKIAHENDLTMAAHARVAETYLLDRIKALSINVTNGAETLSAYIYLVDAIVKAKFGIQTRLRMDPNARFRALLPYWLVDLLKLDNIQTNDGNRFASEGELVSYLRSFGIEPAWYLDSPSTGASQIADAAQTAAAIDPFPDTIQWAMFPEGAFIHLDGGSLELGLVRDSTLNSTNDFQMFGEVFENVARLAPAQAAYWITSDLCANGMLAPAGTARTCD